MAACKKLIWWTFQTIRYQGPINRYSNAQPELRTSGLDFILTKNILCLSNDFRIFSKSYVYVTFNRRCLWNSFLKHDKITHLDQLNGKGSNWQSFLGTYPFQFPILLIYGIPFLLLPTYICTKVKCNCIFKLRGKGKLVEQVAQILSCVGIYCSIDWWIKICINFYKIFILRNCILENYFVQKHQSSLSLFPLCKQHDCLYKAK